MNALMPAPMPYLLERGDFPAPYTNFELSFGPVKVAVSAPMPGDATLAANEAETSEWLSLGVPATVVPGLRALVGEQAELFTEAGRRVCGLTVEKVDARFNVLVGRRAHR